MDEPKVELKPWEKVIDIPGFDDDREDFTVTVRRVSMLHMVSSGQIPNPLMNTAKEIFDGKIQSAMEGEGRFEDVAKVMNIVAQNALVSPTYEEIGSQLTDTQRMAIYSYAVRGAKALESFRAFTRNVPDGAGGRKVGKGAE